MTKRSHDSKPPEGKRPNLWVAGAVTILLAAVAGLLLREPISSLFAGIFSWSVARPETWEGGLELVVLYLVLVAVGSIARRPVLRGVLVAVPLLFYLRRHHVDLAVLVSLCYLEALVGYGAALGRALRESRAVTMALYLRWFVAGVAVWSVAIIAASIAGVATPTALRVLLVLTAVPALAYARRPPLTVDLVRRFLGQDRRLRWISVFFLVFIAGLFARTNAAPDYDSLWYGLRSQLVLTADGSIFHPSGLVAGVYYYPKLFEALLLPLSGLGDFSLVIGWNLVALAMLGVTAHELGRRLGMTSAWASGAAALVVSLPAAAGIATGAKPDLFAALLLSLAALFFCRFVDEGSVADGLVGLSAVGLSLVTKLTSLPYGGLLVVATGLVWWWHRARRTEPSGESASGPFAWSTFAAAAVTGTALTLRTYLLAGVPTIVPVGLWRTLGFDLRPPVGTIVKDRASQVAELPALARGFLLNPNDLPHVRITWPGNSWFFLLVAAAVLWLVWRRRSTPLSSAAAWLPVIGAGVFFALFYNNSKAGGDGNYYIYPVVLLILLAVRAVAARAGRLAGAMALFVAIFVGQQAAVSFVTCHWDPGTRTWDLDLSRSVFDTEAARRDLLRQNGLDDIADFLRRDPGIEHVVGYGPESALYWLPARFESLRVMKYFKPNPLTDGASFVRFLHDQDVELVVEPRRQGLEPVEEAIDFLARQPGVDTLDDDLYRLIDLRPIHERLPALADELPVAAPERIYYRFHQHLDGAEMTGQAAAQIAWGKAIAPVPASLLPFTGRPGIIMNADTGLAFTVDLPKRKHLGFTSAVGIHPRFAVDDRGDGAVVTVKVTPEGGGKPRILRREIVPGEGFVPLELPLGALLGRKVRVELHGGQRARPQPRR